MAQASLLKMVALWAILSFDNVSSLGRVGLLETWLSGPSCLFKMVALWAILFVEIVALWAILSILNTVALWAILSA